MKTSFLSKILASLIVFWIGIIPIYSGIVSSTPTHENLEIIVREGGDVDFTFNPSKDVTVEYTLENGAVATGNSIKFGPSTLGKRSKVEIKINHLINEVPCENDRTVTFYVTVPNITIEKVWSDQLPFRENVNFFTKSSSAGTGKRGYNYILMGERADGIAYAKARVTLEPDTLKDRLLVRFGYSNPGTFHSDGEGSITDDVASMSLVGQGNIKYLVVAGIDSGNGQLEPEEIFASSYPRGFEIIDHSEYGIARTYLSTAASLASYVYPFASNFLSAFTSSASSVPGATGVWVAISKSELDHAVGADFNASGNGNIYEFQFPASSDLSTAVRNSEEFLNLVNLTLYANRNQVKDYFTSNPSAPPKKFTWQLKTTDGLISFGESMDLHLAFGTATIDCLISVTVNNALEVEELTIDGNIADLYDWDYETGGSDRQAATLQAGYSTISTGGRVFKSRVFLKKTFPYDYSF